MLEEDEYDGSQPEQGGEEVCSCNAYNVLVLSLCIQSSQLTMSIFNLLSY
jgi:hypothetical protein